MKHFKLGPNGAIMTSLNLFATKFDQVLDLLAKREAELDYILVDTPGQIEAPAWFGAFGRSRSVVDSKCFRALWIYCLRR